MLIKFCIFILSIAVILNALSLGAIRTRLKSMKKDCISPENNNISESNLNRFE